MQHFKEMGLQASWIGGNLRRHKRESQKKKLAVLFQTLPMREELLVNRLMLNIQIMLIILRIAFFKSI